MSVQEIVANHQPRAYSPDRCDICRVSAPCDVAKLGAHIADIREITTRYLSEPNVAVAAAVRPEIRRWLKATA